MNDAYSAHVLPQALDYTCKTMDIGISKAVCVLCKCVC